MAALNPLQKKLKKQVTNPWKFKFFLLSQLPMGLIAGLRIRELDESHCVTSVPFKWLTKNPFRSVYFAVQCMAAELSTAAPCMLAVQGQSPSVAFIIVDLKSSFLKKATGWVIFSCADGARAFEAVEKAISTGEAKTATFRTEGRMADNTLVSTFEITWSFKQRSS